MLSKYVKVLLLCCCCSLSLEVFGQYEYNIQIDKAAILKKSADGGFWSMGVRYYTNGQLVKPRKTTFTPVEGALPPAKLLQEVLYCVFDNGNYQQEVKMGNQVTEFLDETPRRGGSSVDNVVNNVKFYLKLDELSAVNLPSGRYTLQYRVTFASEGLTIQRQPVSTVNIVFIVYDYVIIEEVPVKPVSMEINDFSFFKNGYSGAVAQQNRQTYHVKSNTNFEVAVASINDQFAFTMGSEKNSNTGVDNINVIVAADNSPAVKLSLGKTPKLVSVPGGDYKINIDFEIPEAQLRNGFLRAGSYQSEVDVKFLKTGNQIPLSTVKIKPFEVIVKPLSQLDITRQAVDLALRTPSAYQNGWTNSVKNNLTFSSTSKYNITVRAGSERFVDAVNTTQVTLPCGILSIASINEAGNEIKRVVLTTNPQNILSGDAAFETNSGIKYIIRPNSELISAKRGTHTIEVIYGITAQ